MLKFLAKVEDIFCSVALLMTVIVLFINVVLRYVFSASTSWAEELIRYLMVWVTFIGGSICVRKGAHIRMDFLLTFLPEWSRQWVNKLIYLLAAAFCLAMAIYGIQLVKFTVEMGQTSPALGLPMWVPYLAIPLGSGLMVIRFLQITFSMEDTR